MVAIVRANLCLLVASLVFAQSSTPAFEVASVKPSVPGTTGGSLQFLPGGRFSAANVPLRYLIQQIYEIRDFQIVGEPRWMSIIADGYSARYEIQAKGDPAATEARVREMIKTLLADRFQLRCHREVRDLPVYALVPGKGGMKLKLAKDNGRPRGSGSVAFMAKGWIQGSNVALPLLVRVLSELVDRPIVDQTNFADAFDFKLTFTPDTWVAQGPGMPIEGNCPASFLTTQEQRGMKSEPVSCPSIFTALQEQLGMKLNPQKSPIDTLVIDHVERPSAN